MKKRNKFSLSYYKLLSCSMGELVPIGLTEVLPGDTVQHATSLFMRLSPLLAPVMHPLQVKIHHWFVPHRLIWDDFEDFITGGPDGLNTSEFPTVQAPSSGFAVGSLADYLGVPTGVPSLTVSALPFRAYALIYNEWYRDQDLETEIALATTSGKDTKTSTALMRGDWERDYFTTARPWPQKGVAVTVPVDAPAGSAGIISTGPMTFTVNTVNGNGTENVNREVQFTAGGYLNQANPASTAQSRPPQNISAYGSNGSGTTARDIQGSVNFYANTQGTSYNSNPVTGNSQSRMYYKSGLGISSTAGGLGSVDINALREAFALQRYEEHRAMYGSRYVEYLRYLGIKASDARLQRPEYLGGGRQVVQFSEVLQTAEGANPVGTLRGHGVAAMRSNRYRRFIEEHGYILSFLTVRPKAIYMQGLPRTWNRRVKEDFYQRELQHIGQQEVLKKELYAASEATGGAGLNTQTGNDSTFGYQNRYDEYRQHESSVSGEFRTTLNYWHMARDFSNSPALNADFINAVPTTRIFASTDTDNLYIMANHSMQARRLMPKYGNPI